MTIEAGKYYKTRSGKRVFVCATNKPGIYPVVAWFDDGDYQTFTETGRVVDDKTQRTFDIISEWRDQLEIPWDKLFPPWVKWFAVDADGTQCGYEEKPEMMSFGWVRANPDKGYVITAKHMRVKFDGRWKESLTERRDK